MRVMIDGRPIRDPLSGVGQYVYQLVKELCVQGGEEEFYDILYFNFQRKNKLLDFSYPNLNITEFRWFHRKLFNIWAEWLETPQINWCGGNLDVAHYTFFGRFPIKRARTRSVATIHDTIPLDRPELFTKANLRYSERNFYWQVKNCDVLIAVSEYTKGRILHHADIDPDRIKVIYNGASDNSIEVCELDANQMLMRWNIDQPFFLYVGNLEPRKNLLTLLKAYAKLAQKQGTLLVIAGKPCWYFQHIFDFVKENGLESIVRFTGYVSEEEKALLLQKTIAFIYPSEYEGFGIPVIEAMKNGAPVICANNSSLTEIASNGALLFETFDDEELAGLMTRMLEDSDLRMRIIHEGKEHAKQFSWRKMARETANVYKLLC